MSHISRELEEVGPLRAPADMASAIWRHAGSCPQRGQEPEMPAHHCRPARARRRATCAGRGRRGGARESHMPRMIMAAEQGPVKARPRSAPSTSVSGLAKRPESTGLQRPAAGERGARRAGSPRAGRWQGMPCGKERRPPAHGRSEAPRGHFPAPGRVPVSSTAGRPSAPSRRRDRRTGFSSLGDCKEPGSLSSP